MAKWGMAWWSRPVLAERRDGELLRRLKQLREEMQAERDRAERLRREAEELKRLAARQSYPRDPKHPC